jgi:hypothetical protein
VPQDDTAAIARRKIVSNARCCLDRKVKAWLEFTRVDYDDTTKEFTATAVLVRGRDVNGRWPLVMRARKLTSTLGRIEALNADNAESGEGAAWVFSELGTMLEINSAAALNTKFLPAEDYEFSEPRPIHFRLEPAANPIEIPNGGLIVEIHTEVLVLRK